MLLDQPGQVGALDVLHDQEVRVAGLVGVVGQDDVGVVTAGPPPGPRGGSGGRRRRSASRSLRMTLRATTRSRFRWRALKTCAHAALAQPLQQDVGTQDQFLAAALEELVDLVGGQPAAVDELAGQGPRFGRLPRELAGQFVELGGFQEAEPPQGVHELGGGNHGPDSPWKGVGATVTAREL